MKARLHGLVLCLLALAGLLQGCPTYPEEPSLPPWRDADASDEGISETVETVEVFVEPCPWGVLEENLFLTDAAELADYANCVEIRGSFNLMNSSASTISLPFESIQGELGIGGNAALSWIDLSRLRSVGSLSISENPRLQQIQAPWLEEAGTIQLENNDALGSLSLPSLRTAEAINLGFCYPNAEGCAQADYTTNDGLTELILPQLASLGWLQIVDHPRLQTLSARLLSQIDGLRIVRSGPLELSLPQLASAATLQLIAVPVEQVLLPELQSGGELELSQLDTLARLEAPKLSQLSALEVKRCDAFEALALPALLQIESQLLLDDNARLGTVELPELGSSMSLTLSRNLSLAVLELPALTSTAQLTVSGHALLDRVSLPQLATLDSFIVRENARLNSLALDALTAISTTLEVIDNPALPQCWVDAMLQQLSVSPTSATSSGNDDAAICP